MSVFGCDFNLGFFEEINCVSYLTATQLDGYLAIKVPFKLGGQRGWGREIVPDCCRTFDEDSKTKNISRLKSSDRVA